MKVYRLVKLNSQGNKIYFTGGEYTPGFSPKEDKAKLFKSLGVANRACKSIHRIWKYKREKSYYNGPLVSPIHNVEIECLNVTIETSMLPELS